MEFSDYVERNPLLRASLYSQIQIEILLKIGAEIEQLLEQSFSSEGVAHGDYNRAYGLFWLWVLGVFEVLRTLTVDPYKSRLSESLRLKLDTFKGKVVRLRAPMAKHKYAGSRQAIDSELSISGVSLPDRDFCFSIGSEVYWARKLIAEFREVILSVKPEDVRRE